MVVGGCVRKSKRRDVLIFGRSGDAKTFDPARANDGETFYATTQVYDTLVQFKYGTVELEPALATSWRIEKGGLEVIFSLRRGVEFHRTKYFPGAEFSAKDVVFSFKRQMDPKHPYHRIGGRSFSYWMSMGMNRIVKDVVALDRYRVKFILHKRDATFLSNLAMNFASILSKDYADMLLREGRGEEIAQKPVGTGPFIFDRWIKGDRIVYRANEKYWGGAPKFKWLVLKTIPDQTARAVALRAGEIDIMDFPAPEEVPSLERDPNIKIVRQEGLNVGYMAMNMEKKPFDDVRVRRAIYHAINKKAIVRAVFGDLGVVAVNPLPPTVWGYHRGIRDYEYNPELAKKLLKEAGYPEGFETDLWAMPIQRPYMPNARKLAEAVQADLAKVGVRVKIVQYDWATYQQKLEQGEHGMALLGWTGDNGDPDNFLYVLLSSTAAEKPATNIAFFRNKEFDRLLEEAKVISDRKKRASLYRRAQEIFHREVPWVPLAHSVVVVPMNKRVEGFRIDPVGSRRFHKVYLRR
ncbi:MAG: ABC transporter substrate-binding protein [Planctomycetota bacterium]|nr:MAG: ABC transporter substrate-binding protein [Planctomycetota bacterium]